MKWIKKFVEIPFWKILLYGGCVLTSMIIVLMLIGFVIALFSDYGRLFAFPLSTFFTMLYGYGLLLYFPMKLLLKLKQINLSI
ncbi:hypothetical protein [Persicobacter psychrovividus]|uniref:Uncharacterized protein n=1 Tax=Persicobacter psychrovividus TaxID=387638 RepID=A0ABM7VM35_9BACT|nr:hypothetical protein PEPS_43530 [Persicobacter psychrovividus]